MPGSSTRPAPSTSSTRRAAKCSPPRSSAQLRAAGQQATATRETAHSADGTVGLPISVQSAERAAGSPQSRAEPRLRRARGDGQAGRSGTSLGLKSRRSPSRLGSRADKASINVLDASGISKTQKDKGEGPARDGGGFEIKFEMPIYDFGRAKVREGEQRYIEAVNLLGEMAVNARSEAREAYSAYKATSAIAAQYEREVLAACGRRSRRRRSCNIMPCRSMLSP